MVDKVESFWDKASEDYRRLQWENTAIGKFDFEETKESLLRNLKLKKKYSVLEFGCGPGKWTKLVSRRCKNITAVDISGNMIIKATKYCEGIKNVRFLKSDIDKIKLTDKFDRIFAVRVFEYVKDKEAVLKKLSKLLKKSGKIIIITKTSPCLWESTTQKKGFWQNKVNYNDLENLMKKIGLKKIISEPIIIRMPIFIRGNREFPLVNSKEEAYYLNFFKKITKMSKSSKSEAKRMFLSLSESYVTSAEKP